MQEGGPPQIGDGLLNDSVTLLTNDLKLKAIEAFENDLDYTNKGTVWKYLQILSKPFGLFEKPSKC